MVGEKRNFIGAARNFLTALDLLHMTGPAQCPVSDVPGNSSVVAEQNTAVLSRICVALQRLVVGSIGLTRFPR